jgi:16S rRNA processing protein RimM
MIEKRGIMQEKFQIGAITSGHGVRGEVKVFPTTDDPMKFKKIKKVILDTGKEELTMEIESVKFFKNMAILKFKGYNNLNDVECFKGKTLWITRKQAVPLEKDEYYKADLIGLEVMDENGEKLGCVTNVIETGANDVYEVALVNDKTILLPAIKECILDIDVKAGKMKVHLMDGLADIAF